MMPATVLAPKQTGDTLAVRFIAEGDQSAADIAGQMADFISLANDRLDLAAYDCRLDEDSARPIRDALRDRLKSGVAVRLIYDDSFKKPQSHSEFESIGGDFAEGGTHERVEELGLPAELIRGIQGEGLMHQKFMVRDRQAVWTGSMNWTNDSMTRMENTIVSAVSSELAALYERDFEQLWNTRQTLESGKFATSPVQLQYAGKPVSTDVDFSPGQGEHINEWVARKVLRARTRIVFCSMLINSSKLLEALTTVLDQQKLELWGVYDKTQMDGVLHQWNNNPHVTWKVEAIQRLLREAEMIGKHSLPYRPGHSHNFMHNKLLVVDDVVITGSYNLSHSAQANAENMLAIDSPELAADAITYTEMLRNRFLIDPRQAEATPTGRTG
jgi:phosphatidylserine/phosphatidylglycerophosphate/cardiolipin synthase-like enzyme